MTNKNHWRKPLLISGFLTVLLLYPSVLWVSLSALNSTVWKTTVTLFSVALPMLWLVLLAKGFSRSQITALSILLSTPLVVMATVGFFLFIFAFPSSVGRCLMHYLGTSVMLVAFIIRIGLQLDNI